MVSCKVASFIFAVLTLTVTCFPPNASGDSSCPDGKVKDCSGDACWPQSWVADSVLDCEDAAYGSDLSCHQDQSCPAAAPGCDGIAGSGKVEDECGVCNGNGKSCGCANGGNCDVFLTIEKSSLSQSEAIVTYCSSVHFRGYQFTVEGADLTSWESAIHEMYTQCSSATNTCLGFGYTDNFGYSLHHVNKNANPDSSSDVDDCNLPLVTLGFVPRNVDEASISLNNIQIGGDYNFYTGGTRAGGAVYPVPQVKYWFGELTYDSFVVGVTTDSKLRDFEFEVECTGHTTAVAEKACDTCDGFELDITTLADIQPSTQTENEVVTVSLQSGEIAAGTSVALLKVRYQKHYNGNLETAKISFKSKRILIQPASLVQWEVQEPEPVRIPTVQLSLQNPTLTSVDLMYKTREPVRGFQFRVRGVNVNEFETGNDGFDNKYFESFGDERMILSTNINGNAQPQTVNSDADYHLLTLRFQKQVGGATIAIRDLVVANGNSHMVTTSLKDYSGLRIDVARCDNKWEGLCDMEDADGDGCLNHMDFSPLDASMGCGPCGDVSDDAVIDILDIVKTVNVVSEQGEYDTTADVNVDGTIDVSDVVRLVSWVVDPLGDNHPVLPNCGTR